MENKLICTYCGKFFVVVAITITLSTPMSSALCEKCKEQGHQDHTHEETPRMTFLNENLSGVVSSVASSPTFRNFS